MDVLVIEDDAIVAVMQKMWISKISGKDPWIFSNGKEAIDWLDSEFRKENSQSFLIFLDINMPVMNGWEFLDLCESRPYSKSISVVIVTSSEFHEDFEKSQSYSMVVGYQTKPIDANNITKFLP